MMNEQPGEGNLMTDIYTVDQLLKELSNLPRDAPVMLCVIKYPGEFGLRPDGSNDGELAWDDGDDVEVHPLEHGEVTLQRGMVYLAVELDEFNPDRAQLNGG